jgi:hypothetical protein
MMGQHARSASLFYYFRLEDQVPENHLLCLVDKHIDFGCVRDRLCTGSAASASSSRSCACTLRSAGSLVSASTRKFRITPRFRRIAMDASRNRMCSSSCSRKLWRNASQSDWCVETGYRLKEPSWRQTLPRRAATTVNAGLTLLYWRIGKRIAASRVMVPAGWCPRFRVGNLF